MAWVIPIAGSAALGAACRLDTAALGPVEEPLTPASADASAGAPTSSTPAEPPPAPTSSDARDSATDASPREVDDRDSAPGHANSCDLDNDGHLAMGCGGDDCCDVDPRAHPGVTPFFPSKNECDAWDYDCSGAATPEFGVATCQPGFFACKGDGFATATPCGEVSTFTHCSWNFGCHEATSTELQRCR